MGREAFAALILFGNRYGGQGITWLSNFAPRHDTYLIWPLDGTPALLTQLFNHVPDAQRVSVIANTRSGGAAWGSWGVCSARTLDVKGQLGASHAVSPTRKSTWLSYFPRRLSFRRN